MWLPWGTERIRRSDGLTVYDSQVWASEIDKRTSPDVSVSELAEIIKKQVPVTFAAFVAGIKAGQVTKEKFPTELPNNYLVYYIVAGMKKVNRLATESLRESTRMPKPSRVLSESGKLWEFLDFSQGYKAGIIEIASANSDQNRKIRDAGSPANSAILRLEIVLPRTKLPISSGAYLGMEAEAEPQAVGFPNYSRDCTQGRIRMDHYLRN